MRYTNLIKSGFLTALAMMLVVQMQAQFDDLYYTPSKDRASVKATRAASSNSPSYNTFDEYDNYDNYSSRQSSFDNAEYEFYDDYHYASRINRFHRVNPGFGFYDPFFMDPFYYDPFMMNSMAFMNPWMMRPGLSMSFGFGYGMGFNRWNRMNRWNMWGCPPMGMGFNSFGMGYNMGFNQGFGMGMGMGMGMMNPYMMNPFMMGGGMMNPYMMGGGFDPYFAGGGVFVNNTNNVNNNTVFGPRRGGAVTSTDRATPRTGRLTGDDTSIRSNAAGNTTRENVTNDGVNSRSTRDGAAPTRNQGTDRTVVDRAASVDRATANARGGNDLAASNRRFFDVERADRTTPSRSTAATPSDPANRRSPVTSPARTATPQRNMTPARRSATPQRNMTPARRSATPQRSMTPQRTAPTRSNQGFDNSRRSNNRYDSAPSRTSPSRSPGYNAPSRSTSPSRSPSFNNRSSSPSRMSPSRSSGGSMSPRSSGGSAPRSAPSRGGGRRG